MIQTQLFTQITKKKETKHTREKLIKLKTTLINGNKNKLRLRVKKRNFLSLIRISMEQVISRNGKSFDHCATNFFTTVKYTLTSSYLLKKYTSIYP